MKNLHILEVIILAVLSSLGVMATPVNFLREPPTDRNSIPPQCLVSFDVLFKCFKDMLCNPANHTEGKVKCLDGTDDWCFEDFGCPVPRLPTKIFDTTYFELYTETSKSRMVFKITLNTDQSYNLDATINLDRPLKIIVHGLGNSIESSDWMKTMKDNILDYHSKRNEKVNVILVDYREAADDCSCTDFTKGAPAYMAAIGNQRLVGKQIARLVIAMEKKLGKRIGPRTHLIGYSLGGQVIGNAGMYYHQLTGGQKMKQITGLDIAQPLFEGPYAKSERMDQVRTDPTDATFVEAIHTNGYVSGIKKQVGHVDFYPNGGMIQPGCEATEFDFLSSLTSSCSHNRSVEIFLETMMDGNGAAATGFACDDIEHFVAGQCFSQPKYFSYGRDKVMAAPSDQRYFLVTGSDKENGYLERQCKLNIQLNNLDQCKLGTGTISLRMKTAEGTYEDVEIGRDVALSGYAKAQVINLPRTFELKSTKLAISGKLPGCEIPKLEGGVATFKYRCWEGIRMAEGSFKLNVEPDV